jgi:riboflavin synthase alpha subunit
MFTGLIEATGRIDALERDARGVRLRLRTALAAELRPGDSLAVNGVCLTVTSSEGRIAAFDVAPVTLDVTSLGSMVPGRLVNLERPVRAADRMGGHFVLGHVDGTSEILSFAEQGDSSWLDVALPLALEPYVIPKGSIAIDGVSLTVAALDQGRLSAQIIPFTRAHTALAEARTGDIVNLEVDVLGKYVARLLSARLGAAADGPDVPPVPSAVLRALSGEPS